MEHMMAIRSRLFFGCSLSLAVIVLCAGTAVAQRMRFQYLTVEDGLSQNSVVSIAQDSLGFMWFGTRNGLSRYDGYEFRIFESSPDDSLSLLSNAVNSLETGSDTTLWIGTSQGLCMWDQRAGKIFRMNRYFGQDSIGGHYSIGDLFTDSHGDLWVMGSVGGFHIFRRRKGETNFRKRLTLRDPPGFIEGFYGQFMEDDNGDVWIGTSRRGIWKYTRDSDSFAPLSGDESLQTLAVSAMVRDHEGVAWIGTLNGLYRWNKITMKPEAVEGLNDQIVRSLYVDRAGRVWVGTDSGGLSVYDEATKSFRVYNEKSGEGNGLLHNSVQCIYAGRQGIMWLGTYAGGVNFHDPNRGVFHNYQASADRAGLNSNIITGFAEDRTGNIWIATDRGGLSYLDRETNTFRNFRHDNNRPHSISTDIIQHISVTHDNGMLIGTWQQGLDRYDPESDKFFHNVHRPGDDKSLVDNSINNTFQDSKGYVWVGSTRGLSVSLKKLDEYKPAMPLSFRSFRNDLDVANSLSNNYVTTIYEDKGGFIWIGTWAGLNQWDPGSGAFFNVNNNPRARAVLTAHHILCMTENDEGHLLIGTNDSGFFLYDPQSNNLQSFTKHNGLPSNTVVGIQRGTKNDWWISTSNGLVRFNSGTNTLVSYNRHDGLPSNEFRAHASARLRNGELLFGGNNGFTRFHPDSIKTNRHAPLVSFTGFRLFNQVVEPSAGGVLTKDISVADHITLTAYQSSFGIDFIGINFTASQKNTYAYRMEGIDEDWNFVGSQHSAYYSYLPAGEYIFRARAANSDGVWSEPISISLTITPYWWNTRWFRTLAICICLAAVWLLFYLRTRQLVMRKKMLEQTVKERTVELEGKNQMLSEAK